MHLLRSTHDYGVLLNGEERASYFQIAIGDANVLLIDDDCGADYERYYTRHIFTDPWDVSVKGCPEVTDLLDYQSVVWFTGGDRHTTLTREEQQVVAQFLDAGGKLFLTGQNIAYDLAASGSQDDLAFLNGYLHANFVEDSSSATMTMGTNGNPMTNGLFVNLTGPVECADNQTSPDVISPIEPATTMLSYIPGFTCAAISNEDAYTGARLVYLAFGFEGIAGPQETSAKSLLQNILAWFQTSTEVEQEMSGATIPKKIILRQNYPNPFNNRTHIKYFLPEKELVSLKLYNTLGEEISELVHECKNSGEHEIAIDGKALTSGLYFYTLRAGSFSDTKKFLILK